MSPSIWTPPTTPNDAKTSSLNTFTINSNITPNIYQETATADKDDGSAAGGSTTSDYLVYYPIINPVNTSPTLVQVLPGSTAQFTFTDATDGRDGAATWAVWSSVPPNSNVGFANISTVAPHQNTLYVETSTTTPPGTYSIGIQVQYFQPICRQSDANAANVVVQVDAAGGPTPPPPSPNPSSTGCGGGQTAIGRRIDAVRPEGSGCPVQTPNPLITEMYATQAIQYSQWNTPQPGTPSALPLVAGRKAVVRVFVVAPMPSMTPPATVHLDVYGADGKIEIYKTDVRTPGGLRYLKTALKEADEETFGSSYDATIPANFVVPGMQLKAVGNDAAGHPVTKPYPGSGPRPVPVPSRHPTTMAVEFVSLQINNSNGGNLSAANTSLVGQWWPLQNVTSTTLAPITIRGNYSTPLTDSDQNDVVRQLYLLKQDAREPAPPRFWVALYRNSLSPGVPGGRHQTGLAKGPVAVVGDDPLNAPEGIAHEVGHEFGLNHAPCPSDINNRATSFFPEDATLGAVGYNTNSVSVMGLASPPLVEAIAHDVMSYCEKPAYWVSAYNWNLAFSKLIVSLGVASNMDAQPAPPGMVGISIGGNVAPGAESLGTGYGGSVPFVETIPSGPYVLSGYDAKNTLLFQFHFAPSGFADSPGAGFGYLFPVPQATLPSLHRLTLLANGKTITKVAPTQTLPPTATVSPGATYGTCAIVWDAIQWPAIHVRSLGQNVLTVPTFQGGSAIAPCVGTVIIDFLDNIKELSGYQFKVTSPYQEYTVPGTGSNVTSLTYGPDGNVWFTDYGQNMIGKVSSAGVFALYSIPTANAGAQAITPGPDGALWFTERFGNKIGRVTTSGAISEFAIPTSYSEPYGIATGPDNALWFVESQGNNVGRVSLTGSFTEYNTTNTGAYCYDPLGITSGSDRALWVTAAVGNCVMRVSAAGLITPYVVGGDYAIPGNITSGPDGALWFAYSNGAVQGGIGRMTTSGAVSRFPTATTFADPQSILTASTSALWFTENGSAGTLGRMTTSGTLTELSKYVPAGKQLQGLAVRPDGTVWFSEQGGTIGVFNPSGISLSSRARLR